LVRAPHFEQDFSTPRLRVNMVASDESLEAILLGLADRADLGRPVSGAQIAADLASPHRQRQVAQAGCRRRRLRLLSLLWRRSPLRYGTDCLLAAHDGL